jgi:hypothetical protein
MLFHPSKIRMLGVFLTCTAMCGSGVPTGMAAIPLAVLPILKVPLQAMTGCSGEVAQVALLGTAARLSVTGMFLTSDTAVADSG